MAERPIQSTLETGVLRTKNLRSPQLECDSTLPIDNVESHYTDTLPEGLSINQIQKQILGVISKHKEGLIHIGTPKEELVLSRQLSRNLPDWENDPRGLAYLRVSTGDQRETGFGLDSQLRHILSSSLQLGFPIRTIIWEDSSAVKSEQPMLEKSISLIHKMEDTFLVLARLDRGWRHTLRAVSDIRRLGECDSGILSLDGVHGGFQWFSYTEVTEFTKFMDAIHGTERFGTDLAKNTSAGFVEKANQGFLMMNQNRMGTPFYEILEVEGKGGRVSQTAHAKTKDLDVIGELRGILEQNNGKPSKLEKILRKFGEKHGATYSTRKFLCEWDDGWVFGFQHRKGIGRISTPNLAALELQEFAPDLIDLYYTDGREPLPCWVDSVDGDEAAMSALVEGSCGKDRGFAPFCGRGHPQVLMTHKGHEEKVGKTCMYECKFCLKEGTKGARVRFPNRHMRKDLQNATLHSCRGCGSTRGLIPGNLIIVNAARLQMHDCMSCGEKDTSPL